MGFIIKKILTTFLLPPGIFIAVFVFSGICFFIKKYWKTGAMNCLIAMCMWIISASPMSDIILRGLESEFEVPKNLMGDVIILLGGGVYEGVIDLSGVGAPSEEMICRISTAVRLQKKLKIPIIVSGGKVFERKIAEATIDKRFLMDLGVPADKIILEDKSRDTLENAKYTKEVLKKYGYEKPILVTSAYHMKRSILSFEKVGIEAIPFPACFKTWSDKTYVFLDYMPSPSAFKDGSTAVHEYAGLLFYRLVYR